MAQATQSYVTPIGTGTWVQLHEPSTTYNPDGVYEVKLRLDPQDPDVQKLLEEIKDYVETSHALEVVEKPALKNYKPADLFTDEYDEEGNPTGFIFIKAKRKAHIVARDGKEYDFDVAVFDASGQPYEKVPPFGSGTELMMGGSMAYYTMGTTKTYGASLRLERAKIIKPVIREDRPKTWE